MSSGKTGNSSGRPLGLDRVAKLQQERLVGVGPPGGRRYWPGCSLSQGHRLAVDPQRLGVELCLARAGRSAAAAGRCGLRYRACTAMPPAGVITMPDHGPVDARPLHLFQLVAGDGDGQRPIVRWNSKAAAAPPVHLGSGRAGGRWGGRPCGSPVSGTSSVSALARTIWPQARSVPRGAPAAAG